MKGLLYKDLLVINSYKKSYALMFIIYIFLGFSNKGMSSFSILGCYIVAIMAAISTFSYDELSKWDNFALTMPITRKDIVKSKYILVIILLLASFILSMITYFALTLINKTSFNVFEMLEIVLSYMLGVSFVLSIFLPLFYLVGVEKGRLYFFIIPVLLGLLGLGVGIIFNVFNIDLSFLNPLLDSLYQIYYIIIPVLIMFILNISYKISYKIYLKK